MKTPGARTSGFNRPSAVGPRLLKVAIRSRFAPFWLAPTARTFFATAYGLIVERLGPEFPAAYRTTKSGWVQTKSSVWAASEM